MAITTITSYRAALRALALGGDELGDEEFWERSRDLTLELLRSLEAARREERRRRAAAAGAALAGVGHRA